MAADKRQEASSKVGSGKGPHADGLVIGLGDAAAIVLDLDSIEPLILEAYIYPSASAMPTLPNREMRTSYQ